MGARRIKPVLGYMGGWIEFGVFDGGGSTQKSDLPWDRGVGQDCLAPLLNYMHNFPASFTLKVRCGGLPDEDAFRPSWGQLPPGPGSHQGRFGSLAVILPHCQTATPPQSPPKNGYPHPLAPPTKEFKQTKHDGLSPLPPPIDGLPCRGNPF